MWLRKYKTNIMFLRKMYFVLLLPIYQNFWRKQQMVWPEFFSNIQNYVNGPLLLPRWGSDNTVNTNTHKHLKCYLHEKVSRKILSSIWSTILYDRSFFWKAITIKSIYDFFSFPIHVKHVALKYNSNRNHKKTSIPNIYFFRSGRIVPTCPPSKRRVKKDSKTYYFILLS